MLKTHLILVQLYKINPQVEELLFIPDKSCSKVYGWSQLNKIGGDLLFTTVVIYHLSLIW